MYGKEPHEAPLARGRNPWYSKYLMKTLLAPGWRLLLAVLALRAVPALAHAGLPETSNVTLRRGHPEHQLVGASFGAVISLDSGQSWQWICPEGMGVGAWRPNRYHWLAGGDLVAATGSALVHSKDQGCSWTTHPFFKDTWVTGLAVHPTDERLMYAATGKPTVANGLYRSEDGSETWTPVLAPTADARYSALHLSPADPRRLYASGLDAGGMFLMRSDDAGQTWTRLAQPLTQYTRPYDLILLKVSATSPDVLWAKVSAQGYTYVLVSRDGGATLTQVLELADVLVDLETSADGATVWAATPVNLYRLREGQAAETLTLPEGNACATRVGDTLYACGSSWVHDWALAKSQDEGTTWEPSFGLHQIQGAYSCPAGTPVQQQCPSRWPQLAELFGAPSYNDGGVEPVPDAGTPEPEPPPKKDGCSAATGLVPAALVLLSLAALRPSRRRPSRSP